MGGACIEQGPLFSSDVGVDGGVAPASGLGGTSGGGATGAAGASAPVGEAPARDAGLVSGEAPPLPDGPIAPPRCDGGASSGCEGAAGASPPPEAACDACLTELCPADVARCDDTDGCNAIVACARRSACELDECYCGTFNDFVCTTTGQANGPCRDVMLAAPGAHPPNLIDPSAGPAAVAARAVGACRLANDECSSVCGG